MRPAKTNSHNTHLFQSQLDQILDTQHPLFTLAQQIDWQALERDLSGCYVPDFGRPGLPVRLMVGLHYLKYAFDMSDESVLANWLENPYWQYFCGYEFMQHRLPLDDSSMTRWRQRLGGLGDEHLERLLKETIDTAKRMKLLKDKHVERVNVDTTVQEKAIAYPTDARLYYKMCRRLASTAKKRGLKLRQSYVRKSKTMLAQQASYARSRKYKKANSITRKLRTIMGYLRRDIAKKTLENHGEIDLELQQLLDTADRLYAQQRTDKHKLYSIDAPEVECISKGKVHKKYEFGCKVALAVTSKNNWVIAAQAYHGNPPDNRTLNSTLEQISRVASRNPQDVYCDWGFRKYDYAGDATKVNLVKRIPKTISRLERKLFKRRAAIEPTIGHMKSGNRLHRNHLKGQVGDCVNALLSAAGYNFRKLLRGCCCAFRCFMELILIITVQLVRLVYSDVKPVYQSG